MKKVFASCALLTTLMLLAACQKEDQQAPVAPRPVLSQIAEPAGQNSFTLPGTVEPRVTTEFGFRILGRIVARKAQVGDLVKKGDLLATIDPLALELAVKSAQSDLANNQAQLVNARTNEGRQRTLFEKQSGAKATFEVAEQERKTAEANVAKAYANLAKANEQLGYARLVAEFDGVVTATSAEVGQVVSAGQTVVTVARPDERDAVLDVPEAAVGLLKPGAEFDVSLQLDPTIRAKALVREVRPEADGATRTRRTRLTLIDPPQALRLGAVITAHAAVGDVPSIRLPSSAVRMDGAKSLVWLVDEQTKKVSSVEVTLVQPPESASTVTVTAGITPGARVVIAGANTLQDGQTVRIDQEPVN
ncbi:efflux RND transporter periplasmic adaptor subunit [Rhizobium leguminosarum bv. viciae]|uniref:efflux RND transporter periplasmic adaptor subunit n=1 Tax=Rhizobium leguminosarum TaxID=384 RepID=UPI0014422736|nr:efflux RND transporter periplasmic adaptor subunit [Rhizobium leguminosarum]NKJ94720.1 efflux RND transporter periplasmic adaptor subunit [Rhizobium leguminosarum bv. viciae]